MRKQDMGNQFSKKTRKKAGSIQAQRIFRSRWFKSLVAMGSAVVFFTVYSLIIPAATLTEDQAAADSGIVLEEPAPSEPQVVETEETPAPEPVAQAAVEETPAAASEETATQTPAEETGTAPSTEQGTSESAAAGSGSEETKETGTKDDAPADTADLNQTASAVNTTETASDGIETEEADAALTEEETAEDATTESSEESVEETTEEEEEIGTVSELKAASGNLEALVRFADGAGIPENASLVIYGAGADTGKVQDALWSGSMDSIERSSITTDLSEYVSFAIKDADGNDITPDSDCSIEISFGSEANLSDPGENRIKKYGTLVVSSDGNVSVTGTNLSTGNGHTYATFTGTLSGNTFGFAVTTADRKVNYLESLSGKTSDGAVEAALSFGKDAKVPEGSSLTVETASVNESSVLDKFWGDEEGVNRDTAKADDIRFVKFVIRDRNGNEVRPETKVSVKLTFHHEADLSEAAEGFVKKHNALAAGPDGTITLGSGALSAGNGITTVSFVDVSAKSAFGYAVTTAEKKIVYATKLTGKSEDGSIEASLRLTEEAKIPEGSLLKVTPVTGESVQKTLLDNIWTDTSIIDPDAIRLTDSGLAKVTITDKDGNVRKPEADAVLTLTFNKEADLAEAARKMVKRAKAVEMTEGNVKLSDSGLSVAEGKTRISYTGIVDGQTFGYAVSTAKQKTNFLDGKLSYEGEDYTIEVSVSKDNQIPENSKLNVKELDKDSEEFKKKLDQAAEAVQKDAEKKSSDDIETSVDDASVRMFDITILNEDGDEIQPNGNVRVSVQYKNAVKVGADAKMKAVHFDEKNDEVQVLTPETKADTSDTEKKVHEVRFNANGFSVYAIVGTETITTEFLSHNGTKYEVTVTYGPDAKIPEGSTLRVTDIDEGTQAYDDARNAVLADKKEKNEFVDIDDFNLAALDISIIDPNGKEIEPEAEVTVDIKIKDLPGVEDLDEIKESLEIQHHVEVTNGVVVEKVFDGSVEGSYKMDTDENIVKAGTVVDPSSVSDEDFRNVEVNEDDALETSFDTEVFSTFTITWRSGGRKVTVHYVDESGRELNVTNSGQGVFGNLNANSNSPAFLIYDINGYEYSYTYRNTNNNNNRIAPLLVKEWGGNGYYAGYRWRYMGANSTSTSELSDDDDIYVVYKKKADVTTGGTPSVDQTETWPDQENPARKPQFGKSSTNNGNGTNNISLTITGPEKPVEKSTPADVIVVFDISRSMIDNNLGNITRLQAAKNATNAMANTLLNGQNSNVRMALISFSTTAQQVSITGATNGFTSNYTNFAAAVNGLSADGGTNWEQALELANQMQVRSDASTFVVFVTDGDPTFRVSRGNVTNGNLPDDMWTGTTYTYYRNNHVFGEGNDDTYDRNFNFAVEQVKKIVGANKNFYSIGISNSVTKVQNLTTQGGVAADHAFIASNTTAMENAFKSITESIKSVLGFGNVEVTDGITALTNAEMKVMQSVDPNSFKYYRYGGENNKYGNG